MVPQPVKAVLILFPITKSTKEARHQEEAKLKDSGQEISSKLWFTKQTVSNACGTVAMLHAFANADVPYKSGSFLEEFMKASDGLDPMERAKLLENPAEGQPDVEKVHQDAGKEGQTAPPPEEENVRFFLSLAWRVTLSGNAFIMCSDQHVARDFSIRPLTGKYAYTQTITKIYLCIGDTAVTTLSCE